MADREAVLAGRLAVTDLPRIVAAVVSHGDDISVNMRFYRDAEGYCVADGSARAEVELICQRCLKPVQLVLDAHFKLAAVDDDKAAAALPDRYDALLCRDGEVAAAEMIEDELLLALPIIAMHADMNECGKSAALLKEMQVTEDAGKPESPFAVLKDLKRH